MPTNEEQSKILNLIYQLQKQHQIHDISLELILENQPTEEELERKKKFC